MTKHRLILLLLSVLLASCTVNNTILVRKDGSATIQADYDDSEIKTLYHANIISNIDTSTYPVTFDISNIDSLGNYMPVFQKGFFEFNMDNNAIFTLTDGHTDAFKTDDSFCCSMNMKIKFPQGIREFKTDNNIAKKKGGSAIIVRKGRNQLLKNQKRIDITVDLNKNS